MDIYHCSMSQDRSSLTQCHSQAVWPLVKRAGGLLFVIGKAFSPEHWLGLCSTLHYKSHATLVATARR